MTRSCKGRRGRGSSSACANGGKGHERGEGVPIGTSAHPGRDGRKRGGKKTHRVCTPIGWRRGASGAMGHQLEPGDTKVGRKGREGPRALEEVGSEEGVEFASCELAKNRSPKIASFSRSQPPVKHQDSAWSYFSQPLLSGSFLFSTTTFVLLDKFQSVPTARDRRLVGGCAPKPPLSQLGLSTEAHTDVLKPL